MAYQQVVQPLGLVEDVELKIEGARLVNKFLNSGCGHLVFNVAGKALAENGQSSSCLD